MYEGMNELSILAMKRYYLAQSKLFVE